MSDRCEVTELLKDQCAHCRPKAKSFTARYDGECITCGRDILAGQPIRETWTAEYEHAGH